MDKVIILHGRQYKNKPDAPPQNIRHWLGWLKKELEKQGFEAINPLIPHDWKASYEDWKKEIEKIKIDRNTILVGTSAGGAFWVRYLGEIKQKAKKLILVAPAYFPGDTPDENNCKNKLDFYNFKIDAEIKNRIKKIVIFTSDNDEERHIRAANLYGKSLSAQIIEIKGRGHFTLKWMGTEKFPELLEEVLKEK